MTSRSGSPVDRDDSVPPDLRVWIERYDDEPDVCTIFDASIPRHCPTMWISAGEGSYVSLESMR